MASSRSLPLSGFKAHQVLAALAVSMALHAGLLAWMRGWTPWLTPQPPVPPETIVMIDLEPPPEAEAQTLRPEISQASTSESLPAEEAAALPDLEVSEPAPLPDSEAPRRAYSDAPAPPSAEEWALASTYPLKNSKRYRYNWGVQVRSLMGRAYEGPDQGMVRFRVVIAPDGSLAELETLWSTSAMAEALARQAIRQMPPLPPTPTGEPLVFERTITFGPNDAEMPPIYKYDCEPDPPRFRNPYVWDGHSAQGPAIQPSAQPLDPQAYAECLKQLPPDSIEAESTNDQRQLERWKSHRLNVP